ncbi:MAG TPA: GNAT family N-acetyltransferase [Thermoplasmata archaeon]|nr:GNAT family N-acetyltransferase [Thermoplasmata archaeon]
MPAATPAARVVVRELRWADFDPIREMYWTLYEERPANPDLGITLFPERPAYADEVDWFSRLYRAVLRGDTVARVAEIDGTVVGHCDVVPVGPGTRSSEVGHVGSLGIVVHRDHRGRGAGEALMRATIAACRGHFDLVRLSVLATNPRARRLYERHGFVPYGRLPGGLKRNGRYTDEDLMVLDLRDRTENR